MATKIEICISRGYSKIVGFANIRNAGYTAYGDCKLVSRRETDDGKYWERYGTFEMGPVSAIYHWLSSNNGSQDFWIYGTDPKSHEYNPDEEIHPEFPYAPVIIPQEYIKERTYDEYGGGKIFLANGEVIDISATNWGGNISFVQWSFHEVVATSTNRGGTSWRKEEMRNLQKEINKSLGIV